MNGLVYKYGFLGNVLNQPDLKDDVYQYLLEPLKILYDLEEKTKVLILSKKTKNINLELQFEIEDVSGRVLPQMIDEYCKFPLEYRNKVQIKSIDQKYGTLKEILLNSLNKIFKQIYKLQDKFYQENQVNFLAQADYVDNKFQSIVGQETITLENKFDLNNFQNSLLNDMFVPKVENELALVAPTLLVVEKENKKVSILVQIACIGTAIGIAIFGLSSLNNFVDTGKKEYTSHIDYEVNEIKDIVETTKQQNKDGTKVDDIMQSLSKKYNARYKDENIYIKNEYNNANLHLPKESMHILENEYNQGIRMTVFLDFNSKYECAQITNKLDQKNILVRNHCDNEESANFIIDIPKN